MAAQPAAAAGTLALGDTFTVNRLGLGAMRLTGAGIWGDPPDPEGARKLLRRAVELGVNFIDTADSYGPETSERLIGEALFPYPKGFVVATKGGLVRPGRDRWEREARPAHLRSACEGSLKRLRVDCIDLYQLHAPDPKVRLEDSIGEIVKLRDEGKVRCIGVSNVSVEELKRAQAITKIVSVQNRYNVDDRSNDSVLDYCESSGITFIPYFPLGAGQHAAASPPPRSELGRIMSDHKVSASQASIAWLLARSRVMLPIPGTSSIAHLEENVAAASVRLQSW